MPDSADTDYDVHNLTLYLVHRYGYSPDLAATLAPKIVADPASPDRPFLDEMHRRMGTPESRAATAEAVYRVVDPYLMRDPGPSGQAALIRHNNRTDPIAPLLNNPLQWRDPNQPDFRPLARTTAGLMTHLGFSPQQAASITGSLYAPVLNHPVTRALMAQQAQPQISEDGTSSWDPSTSAWVPSGGR